MKQALHLERFRLSLLQVSGENLTNLILRHCKIVSLIMLAMLRISVTVLSSYIPLSDARLEVLGQSRGHRVPDCLPAGHGIRERDRKQVVPGKIIASRFPTHVNQ